MLYKYLLLILIKIHINQYIYYKYYFPFFNVRISPIRACIIHTCLDNKLFILIL